jgi:hypothetical protein
LSPSVADKQQQQQRDLLQINIRVSFWRPDPKSANPAWPARQDSPAQNRQNTDPVVAMKKQQPTRQDDCRTRLWQALPGKGDKQIDNILSIFCSAPANDPI